MEIANSMASTAAKALPACRIMLGKTTIPGCRLPVASRKACCYPRSSQLGPLARQASHRFMLRTVSPVSSAIHLLDASLAQNLVNDLQNSTARAVDVGEVQPSSSTTVPVSALR